jgi:hypothetical protein
MVYSLQSIFLDIMCCGHVQSERSGRNVSYCSETTLTGGSQFHRSTPLGIEFGSLMTGSIELTHSTSETLYECSEIAGSPQGSPPAAGCEIGRRSCSKRETGIRELFEIKWDYHIVGTTA